MYRVFGFSFFKPQLAIVFVIGVLVFVFGYHKVIQNSIRKHPDATLRAVQDHCRFVMGKRLGKVPNDELSSTLQRCADIEVKSVEAAGGVFDPVIVRITVEIPSSLPLESTVLVFKSADINTGSFNFLSGLSHLISGRWAFNFFNTYSDTTFRGSF